MQQRLKYRAKIVLSTLLAHVEGCHVMTFLYMTIVQMSKDQNTRRLSSNFSCSIVTSQERTEVERCDDNEPDLWVLCMRMDLIHSNVINQSLMRGDDEEEGQEEEGSILENEDYLQKLLLSTQDSVRQANIIPIGTGYSIRTSNPQNATKATEASNFIISELFSVLLMVCSEELVKGPTAVTTPESLSKNYEKLVDCMENILAKVDKGLTICNTKHPNLPIGPILIAEKEKRNEKSVLPSEPSKMDEAGEDTETMQRGAHKLLLATTPTTASISSWKHLRIDAGRFVPILTFKPHGITPLSKAFYEAQQQVATLKVRPMSFVQELPSLPHPYEDEINALDWGKYSTPEGSNRMFELCEPKIYRPLENTPLVWIRTTSELEEMIKEIKNDFNCYEIAIDLEHHSQHSYRGITCLIQLSIRTKDFIIDPINIQDELFQLNEITANPRILKVLHGADSDVIWLQRDFSVYLVNLFDTGQASRLLNIPGGSSLSNLLMYYCKVKTDKRFQLADWRVRPLTDEMVNYARTDTHYLLYICDKLRNDLLTKSSAQESESLKATEGGRQQMGVLLERSRAISLKLYTEHLPNFESVAANLVNKHHIPIAPCAFSILVGLLEWRETLAKLRDENPQSIVNPVLLLRIANKAPRTWGELQSLANPLPRIIHEKAIDILEIVKKRHNLSEISIPKSTIDEKEESVISSIGHGVVVQDAIQKDNFEVDREIDPSLLIEEQEIGDSISSNETMGFDTESALRPSVLVSVSSSVRRMQSLDDKTRSSNYDRRASRSTSKRSQTSIHRSASLPPDPFEILLTENKSQALPVVGIPIGSRQRARSLEFAELAQNRKVFARAVSNLVAKDFTQCSPPIVSNLSRKRLRTEPDRPIVPVLPESQSAKFETRCEVLIDKVGSKRKKQKGAHLLTMITHPDLVEVNDECLKSMASDFPANEELPSRRRQTTTGRADSVSIRNDGKNATIMSAELLETPVRRWLKRPNAQLSNSNESSFDQEKMCNAISSEIIEPSNKKTRTHKKIQTVVSESVLTKVKDVLPSWIINSTSVCSAADTSSAKSLRKLPSLPTPQYFGNSSVQPSKSKSVAHTKRKKKWK